ncbi:MAG TPA: LLM class flavin-dependent oxidoreductase [Steroidobacteraceae bacterium]|nr:LLM class flavin-dependent oxidoreductase [Steroidobacteraceae bacterium]
MIKPWIFEFCPAFDGATGAEDYSWYSDLWVRAEAIGFEGIFFSEHHFRPGGLSPSPNLLIATVAARTRTLRLGAMGVVVPLYEPWRVAEEAAMLDQLSGGRLEFGLSSGSGPMEPLRVGIPAGEIRPRFAEALEILDKALTRPRFSHQGRFWKFDDLVIAPRPLQQPRPPMWVAGMSPEAAEMCARRNYGFCTGFLPVSRVRELFERYQAEAHRAGGAAGPGRVALRRQVLISDDAAEAAEMGKGAFGQMSAMLSGGAPDRGREVPDAPAARHGPMLSPEECIAGTPAAVAEQIVVQCRQARCAHILGYSFGPLTRAQLSRSYELWRQVIPVLRKAEIAP